MINEDYEAYTKKFGSSLAEYAYHRWCTNGMQSSWEEVVRDPVVSDLLGAVWIQVCNRVEATYQGEVYTRRVQVRIDDDLERRWRDSFEAVTFTQNKLPPRPPYKLMGYANIPIPRW